MRHFFLTAALVSICAIPTLAQNDCEKRTIIGTTSLDQSGFMLQNYPSDLLDSLYWDFGDGQTLWQTSNIGTGNAVHTYASPGTYTVTLERWGSKDYPDNTTPLHCTTTCTNVVYPYFTDSLCGGDFLMFTNGNVVTFSNTSVIHAPSFNSHSTEPLWDFGNGMFGIQINTIYDVTYEPGTYTACLYYGGFSFNDGGYLYDCATCSTFTVVETQGMQELEPASLRLHPNPAAAFIELTSDDLMDAYDIVILDQAGRIVSTPAMVRAGQTLRLNVESLAPGMYQVRVGTGRATRNLPFVKL